MQKNSSFSCLGGALPLLEAPFIRGSRQEKGDDNVLASQIVEEATGEPAPKPEMLLRILLL